MVGAIIVTEVVDRITLNNSTEEITTEEKTFKYLEQTWAKLAAQNDTYFFNDEIKAGIGIATNVIK